MVLAPMKLIEQYFARSSTLDTFSHARPKLCPCEDPSICDCSSAGLALISSCMFAGIFLLVDPVDRRNQLQRNSSLLQKDVSMTQFCTVEDQKKKGKLPELSKSVCVV